jgi:hypothetical protein
LKKTPFFILVEGKLTPLVGPIELCLQENSPQVISPERHTIQVERTAHKQGDLASLGVLHGTLARPFAVTVRGEHVHRYPTVLVYRPPSWPFQANDIQTMLQQLFPGTMLELSPTPLDMTDEESFKVLRALKKQ